MGPTPNRAPRRPKVRRPGAPRQPRAPRQPKPPLTKRLRPGHWIVLDFVVGGVLALLALFAALTPVGSGVPAISSSSTLTLSLLLAIAIIFAVGLRRRHPLPAYGLLLIVAVLSNDPWLASSTAAMAAAAYVLYTVTVTSSRRTGAAALAAGIATAIVLAYFWHQSPARTSGSDVSVTFAFVICWMVGYATRQRRLYADMLRDQAANSAVADERLRIARELHDVVAHSMAVIAVQAGFGQYVIDSSPSDAREALRAIQATSRDALEEMRRMLGVLRQQDTVAGLPADLSTDLSARHAVDEERDPLGARTPGDAPAPENGPAPADGSAPADGAAGQDPSTAHDGGTRQALRAPLAPEPGIDDLDRLVARTSGAGVSVSLQRFGTPRSLPAGVGLSAYRIIQEALTNVVKHAGSGTRCVVRVRFGDESLDLRVTDDGGQPSSAAHPAQAGIHTMGSGHGLMGMRERVHLCGGQFSAGPLPEGGFEVTALLPLHPAFAEPGRRA
ncbi:MAG: sensor histidine kinase [Trebonia sp.]